MSECTEEGRSERVYAGWGLVREASVEARMAQRLAARAGSVARASTADCADVSPASVDCLPLRSLSLLFCCSVPLSCASMRDWYPVFLSADDSTRGRGSPGVRLYAIPRLAVVKSRHGPILPEPLPPRAQAVPARGTVGTPDLPAISLGPGVSLACSSRVFMHRLQACFRQTTTGSGRATHQGPPRPILPASLPFSPASQTSRSNDEPDSNFHFIVVWRPSVGSGKTRGRWESEPGGFSDARLVGRSPVVGPPLGPYAPYVS